MSTTAPPPQSTDPTMRQGVYRPLAGNADTLGAWLTNAHADGRRIIAGERFRQQRNREAYRGNTYLQPLSLARGTGQIHRMAPADMLESGRRRDTINRLRQFVDGRAAMLTREKPPFDVVPRNRERQSVDGARLATRMVDFEWGNIRGWNVSGLGRKLELWAAQDGLAFANVIYDRSRGDVVAEMMVPGPGGQLVPLTTLHTDEGDLRRQVEALLEADPKGERLWVNQFYPTGEVVLRAVRASALAYDPNMTTDWRDCSWVVETRRRKIVDVEREVGMPIRELLKLKTGPAGGRPKRRTGGTVETDDGSGERGIDLNVEILVHELFHKATGPTGSFPNGAHVMWVQDAPDRPFVEEPWLWPDGEPRDLPYFPYIPRPDGGHLLKTLGTVDELLPVQRQFDRRVSQYGEFLDLVARPPLLLVGGSLRSKSVYNADRVVHVNPGFAEPRFLQIPPDPGIALLQMLGWLERQMAEIAMQSDPVRGQAPPGVEAASAFNTLIQQGEAQLAGSEAEFKTTLEWVVGEALKNVIHFYTISRAVRAPGVEDEAEFQAFEGSMLHGADGFRITGSVLPKNKAAQQAMLVQFMQYAGPRFDPTPFAAEIITGDVEAIVSMEQTQARKQERENIDLAAIGALAEAQKVWETFVAMRDDYVRTMAAFAAQMRRQALEMGVVPPLNPQQAWEASGGPPPPKVLDLLRGAGFRVPTVAITDRHHMHIRALEFFMTNDGFDAHKEIVRQAAQEHLNEHIEAQTRQVAAIGMQSQQMAGATPGAQPAGAPAAPPPPQE